jgi:hypothetical protein
VTLQMLKPGKRPCTSRAYVRPRLVCLGRWEVRIRWPVIVGRGRLRGSASNWKPKISINAKTRDLAAFTIPRGSTRLCHDHRALRAPTRCLLMCFISFCHCSDRANWSCRFQNVRWIRSENRIGARNCRTGRCFASSINRNGTSALTLYSE